MTEDEQPGESERRERLLYWIRRGMAREGMNQTAFAKAIGAPGSTVSRWLNPDEKAEPGITWLGRICSALRLDPMLFAKLPAIPDDPLETFALDNDSDLLTVTDATRLAQLDPPVGEESDPPAAIVPPGPPRKRRRQGARRCSPG